MLLHCQSFEKRSPKGTYLKWCPEEGAETIAQLPFNKQYTMVAIHQHVHHKIIKWTTNIKNKKMTMG
jgi:hypothetical protein